MRMHLLFHLWAALAALLVIILASTTWLIVAAQESPQIDLGLIVDGLDQPLFMVQPDDGTDRYFIVEKGGSMLVLADGKLQETPLLDLRDAVSSGSEQGLLSMALHPDFASNGRFFVDYTDTEGDTRVVEYTVSAKDPNVADAASAREILFVGQPRANHNGGLLTFGPDGFLYIGLGDGGGQGDPDGNAQDISTLLGSILRIDVDHLTDGKAYGIPADNPFVAVKGAAPEIWVYGFRNPWRFSFDRVTGDLYIADVGGFRFEEIDLLPAGEGGGANYGWSLMEGPECTDGGSDCQDDSLVEPVYAYQHDRGCSISGGYVYRGEAIPALQGVYLFGDYCSGLIWGLAGDGQDGWSVSAPFESGLTISSFAENLDGELFVIDLNGAIYQIVPAS